MSNVDKFNFVWEGCKISFVYSLDSEVVIAYVSKERKRRCYTLNNCIKRKNVYDAWGHLCGVKTIDNTEKRISEFIELVKKGELELL